MKNTKESKLLATRLLQETTWLRSFHSPYSLPSLRFPLCSSLANVPQLSVLLYQLPERPTLFRPREALAIMLPSLSPCNASPCNHDTAQCVDAWVQAAATC